ncbi:MAG TPA: NADH-quinone oxidoreductase subunit J, partial [Propionibacteriaceae bacterium]|nr:NADH-quinone oxidoreductase subunit J [Propionibacteriaceae bacterium]
VGVGVSDSIVETTKRHWIASVLAAIGLLILLITGVLHAIVGPSAGLASATASAGGNVPALAERIFTRWVFPFEATSALLITAALGAMVLAHGENLFPKLRQREALQQRMRNWVSDGTPISPLPNSGVFARTNAIGAPALLPDGSVAESSVSKTLIARSAIIDAGELKAPTRAVYAEIQRAAADAEEARS